jgi:hypothetical protein
MYIVFKALFQSWHDVTLFAGKTAKSSNIQRPNAHFSLAGVQDVYNLEHF